MMNNLMPFMFNICDQTNDDALKVWELLHNIYLVLLILIPVLVILFGVIDLAKAVTAGKEDEIKKGQSILMRRIIMGVLAFFVAAIVGFVIGAFAETGTDADTTASVAECIDLFINGK